MFLPRQLRFHCFVVLFCLGFLGGALFLFCFIETLLFCHFNIENSNEQVVNTTNFKPLHIIL